MWFGLRLDSIRVYLSKHFKSPPPRNLSHQMRSHRYHLCSGCAQVSTYLCMSRILLAELELRPGARSLTHRLLRPPDSPESASLAEAGSRLESGLQRLCQPVSGQGLREENLHAALAAASIPQAGAEQCRLCESTQFLESFHHMSIMWGFLVAQNNDQQY